MTSGFREKTTRSFCLAAGAFAVLSGALALLGWVLDLPRLTDWPGSGISMFANTAVCAILGGASLLLICRPEPRRLALARILAGIAAVIGLLTLVQHVFGVDLGIDTLLFNKPWGQSAAAAPMRMGPPASASFLLLAIAIILSTGSRTARRWAVGIGPAVLAVSVLPTVGYFYGAGQLYSIAKITGIAFQTAVVIAALALGVAAANPDIGLAEIVARNDAGGMLVRRIALPLIFFAFVIGWLRVWGEHAGLYDSAFGTALRTLVQTALMLALLWWAGNGISRAERAARLAEQKRLISEQRLRLAKSASRMWVWTFDLRSNTLEQSDWARAINGLETTVTAGDGWNCIHPEDRDSLRSAFKESAASGSEFAVDYRWIRPDNGETIWVHSRGLPERNETGEVAYVVGTSFDVTQRHDMEEALLTADRRKDEFLAVLSHELRNPLAPIRNMVEVAKRSEGDPATLRRAIETIERQLLQMVRLIDELVDVNRISRGKLELQKRPVDMASVVDFAVETSRPMIDLGSHRLSVSLPPGRAFVDGDPVRLSQVLSNLLNNASKFTPPGGEISLAVERIDGEVVARVRDNGSGIEKEKLGEIFEMFKQIRRVGPDGQAGLGIGLTLSRQLIELHGGTIEAYSRGEGAGSEFVIHLPASSGASEPEAAEGPNEGIRRRILVVDDNADSAESMAMLLRLKGNETRAAYSGEEAIERAREFRPNAILLDIGMPNMDGYDVCRALRRDPLTKDSRIIAMTGWGQPEDRTKTREAGFDAHLVKPVDLDRLTAALSTDQKKAPNGSKAGS